MTRYTRRTDKTADELLASNLLLQDPVLNRHLHDLAPREAGDA
jgi:hypothetical protein